MASVLFNSCLDDWARGLIDFEGDTFKCMLVTSAYTPDKDTHTKRSDITDEVAASGGYVAGGFAVAVTVTKDTANDRVNVALAGLSIGSATITARGAVYYKSRGGLASADELVAYVDFLSDISSSNGNWSLTSTTLRLQN